MEAVAVATWHGGNVRFVAPEVEEEIERVAEEEQTAVRVSTARSGEK